MTPQRLAIIRYLHGNTGHPCAEQIHRAVRRSQPNLSAMTVYQTLHTLRDLGEIQELVVGGDRKRFDPNTEAHHHVVCRRCGKMEDIPDRSVRGPVPPPGVSKRYKITGHQVEFFGLCPGCRS